MLGFMSGGSVVLTWVVFLVMFFLAEGVESVIKNNIEDVRLFLDFKYLGYYAVYNLFPRMYRFFKFYNRVSGIFVFMVVVEMWY